MNFNLIKRDISLKEIICAKFSEARGECDLIVPDTKPDVSKILQVDAIPSITQKTVQQGKIYIQGTVRLTVVYVPDGKGICSIFSKLDFSCTEECSAADSSSHIYAEAELEEMDFQILNSRKINIKCLVGVDIKASREVCVSVPEGFDEDDGIVAKYENYTLSAVSAEEEQCFRFREKLEIPPGKADICEIVKINARCVCDSVKFDEQTLSLSGDFILNMVYTDEKGCINSLKETLPFNETLNAIGLPPGKPECSLAVTDIAFDIYEEPDGRRRVLNIDSLICGTFRTIDSINLTKIADVFSTKTPLKINSADYITETGSERCTTQIAHKESVKIPDYLPPIFHIDDCSGTARITNISIEDKKICVSGEILTNLLYSSDDENTSLSGFGHISSFSQEIECPYAAKNSICEARVFPEHIGYNIVDDSEVELRFIIALTFSLFESETIMVISSVEPDTAPIAEKQAPIVICFAQKGETVWDLGKKYRVSPDFIIAENNLDSEILDEGQKICIFR